METSADVLSCYEQDKLVRGAILAYTVPDIEKPNKVDGISKFTFRA